MSDITQIQIDRIPLVPSFIDVLLILDIQPANIFLPNKKSNPAGWRWISEVMLGRRTNVRLSKFGELVGKSNEIPFDLDKIQNLTSWECVYEGQRYDGSEPKAPTLAMEASRIERMALLMAQQYRDSGRIEAGLSDFDFLDISCFHAFIEKNGVRSIDRIRVAKIILLLYFLMCWEVDEAGDNDMSLVEKLLPISRNGSPVRPMRRWMEAMRDAKKCRRLVDLYDCLLAERSTKENPDTRHRVAKRWWQNGELPSWKLVLRIINSLQNCYQDKTPEEIEWAVYSHLAVVRFLDYILLSSREISKQCQAWEDPLALFSDWRTLRRLAQTKRPYKNSHQETE